MNVSNFLRGLQQAKRRKLDAARKALDLAGEQVIGDAQTLTPVATGALQASGTTEPAAVNGTSITKRIGFNQNYAAAVHEVMSAHHPNGQAKYLETAMNRNDAKVRKFIADEMEKA